MKKPDAPSDLVLKHFGVKGMKWGVTRKRHNEAKAIEAKGPGAGKSSLPKKGPSQMSAKDVKRATVSKSKLKLKQQPNATKMVRQLINDHNNLSDNQFHAKYATSKRVIRRRMDRRDPLTFKKVSTKGNLKLQNRPGTKKVTREAIEDHNNLSNKEFFRKHKVTKQMYRRALSNFRDPASDE